MSWLKKRRKCIAFYLCNQLIINYKEFRHGGLITKFLKTGKKFDPFCPR